MRVFLRIKHVLSTLLEWLVILSMGILTLDVLWGVVSRYLLGSQSRWTDELATALLIWVSLLGAALAFGEKRHLGVDYFQKKLHPAAQRWGVGLTFVLVFLFACGVMIYGGLVMVAGALEKEQLLPALGWYKGYVYLALPISGLFVVLYAIEGLAEQLIGVPEEEHRPPSPPEQGQPDTEPVSNP
jgi:TRAP-type C4-dicarboxylate transport system permease small subunit